MKKLLAGLCVVLGTGLVTGCLVPASGYVEADAPVVEFGYSPILYNGYVVYYADGGSPYVWISGAQTWIPEPERPRYVAHYHQYSSAYQDWYRNRGHTYRTHRYTTPNANEQALQPKHKHNNKKKRHN
jgi:hypothetical protein